MPPATRSAAAPELAPALLGALAGIALQLQQPALWSAAAYAAALLAGLLALLVLRALRRHIPIGRSGWRALLAAAAMAALGFGLTGWRAAAYQAQALPESLQGRDIELVGRVAAMPQWSEQGVRFRFAVEQARLDGQPVAVPPQLYLGWYGGPRRADGDGLEPMRLAPDLQAGQRWQFTARLRAPHGTRNPHGFDFELWLWEQGLQATGYVRAGRRDPPPQALGQTWAHPVEWARQQVRDAIVRRAASGTDADAARQRALGIVAALVTGDQRAIARSDWDIFRATGVAHLMSISGLHITLFAWLAAALVRALWRSWPPLCLRWPAQHAGATGGLLLAAGYALFSGWGIPAQRTVLMLATVTLLRLGARAWPWPMVWLLVAAVVALADPWALLQPGFWLSFVAVGILFASGRREASTAVASRAAGWLARVRALLREQLLITVALAPLTLLFFGQVSLVGLLANLLAIPWVTLVLTPVALLGVLWPPLWDMAAAAAQGLAAVLQPLAAWPLATWSAPQAPAWAALAALAGGALIALRLPALTRAAGVPLLLPALLWQTPGPPAGEFELLAADIGQGQAVIVRTHGHALLYDAGPRYSIDSDAGERVLVPLLRALDVRLSRVLLSHADEDHTGGAAAVLAMQPAAQLLGTLPSDHPLLLQREQQPCHAGLSWSWDGVRFEVLHPPPAEPAPRTRRSNALSCVLRVSNGRSTALLAGDIERAQEQRLLAADAPLRADVLLVPHHGSKTSSSPDFVQAVAPRWALVQAGYRNRYGHPAPEVVARYAQQGSTVIDSASCGAAHWRSAQPQALACERTVRRRYWQHDSRNGS
ncbi:MAG: DNA internalization-related competence protein ComEC/Rec2 [Hylemonella sp.]